jgi:hypothetical protein
MIAILLALVSSSGSCVECVAVIAVAWINVLLHFSPQNVCTGTFWAIGSLEKRINFAGICGCCPVAWKNVLLHFSPQNVLVHFGWSQNGALANVSHF